MRIRYVIRYFSYLFVLLVLSGCFLNAKIEDLSSSLNLQNDNISTSPEFSQKTLSTSTTSVDLTETDSDVTYPNSLTLTLNAAHANPLLITLSLVDIYAQNGTDYLVTPLTLTIPPGSLSVNIPITVKGDLLGEGDENCKIIISISDTKVTLTHSEVQINIIDNDPIVLQVSSLFPTAGSNFFDYVENIPGIPLPQVADSTCNYALSSKFDKCLDGGIYRKVIATGQHSCTNLTMTDNLGVFNWKCDSSADPVFFYSTEIKSGKGLKDLLNSANFKTNFVTLLKASTTIATSNALPWWTNTVSPVTLNSGGADPRIILSNSGTINTISGSGVSRGITINAARVGLVILSGSVTSHTTLSGDCSGVDAGTQQCLVLFYYGANLAYFEGDLIGTSNINALIGIDDNNSSVKMIRIHNSSLLGAGVGSGIESFNSTHNGLSMTQSKISSFANGLTLLSTGGNKLFKDVTVANNSNYAFYEASTSWYSKYINLRIINNGVGGITGLGWYSHLQNIQIANNNGYGISLFANGAILKNILSYGNADGLALAISYGVANNITALNNSNSGITFLTGSNYTRRASNILSLNNLFGIIINSTGFPFANLFVSQNNTGIDFRNSSTDSTFDEKLILGSTTNCLYTSVGVTPGLTGVDCDNQAPSAASRTLGASAVGYFQGKVATEAINPHSTGLSVASSITDWFNFENLFRLWGHETAGDLLTATRGRSTGASNARIWDFRLLNTATLAFNANGAFINNVNCPASIHGDITDLYQTITTVPHLRYATEVLFDRIGNDNGLCESNEECIYSPNIGYYQGTGDYLQNTCVFQNGVTANAVTNVKIYSYSQ